MTLCLLFSISILLSGCGFKLRGETTLPPQLHTLYLSTQDSYGSFTKLLKQTLQSMGVVLTQTSNQAPFTLNILDDTFATHVSSVSASTQVVQHVLTYKIIYSIQDHHGHVIIPPSIIVTSRTFTANLNQMLGGSIEQNLLREDMQRDVISQLLNQLGSLNSARALAETIPL